MRTNPVKRALREGKASYGTWLSLGDLYATRVLARMGFEWLTLDLELTALAHRGIAHRRLPRIVGAEQAPTGRATCRACKEKIEQASWRLKLSIFDTDSGRHEPMGFVHAHCGAGYCDGAPATAIVDHARHFAPELDDAAAAQLLQALTPSA